MNKDKIFKEFCNVIQEDGTRDSMYDVYKNHKQNNSFVLIHACRKISEYIDFCMYSYTYWWSNSEQSYLQTKNENTDVNKWLLHIVSDKIIKIFPETDIAKIDYPNLSEMLELSKSSLRYKEIFEKLLNEELLPLQNKKREV